MDRRRWLHPTPVLLPGKSHGRRCLVGCSLWGCKESDTAERLHFHFSLSCIGEGNGNPFQCSCLENPRDRGAWWAAVLGSHRVRHDWSDLAAAWSGVGDNDKSNEGLTLLLLLQSFETATMTSGNLVTWSVVSGVIGRDLPSERKNSIGDCYKGLWGNVNTRCGV